MFPKHDIRMYQSMYTQVYLQTFGGYKQSLRLQLNQDTMARPMMSIELCSPSRSSLLALFSTFICHKIVL